MADNPYAQMLVAFQPRWFYGRESLVITLLRGVTAPEPASFALHGPRRIGRTTLLRYLQQPQGAVERYPQAVDSYGPGRPGELRWVYCDLYRLGGEQALPQVAAALAAQGLVASGASPPAGELDLRSARAMLLSAAAHGPQRRIVLCLDNFDTAFLRDDTEHQFLRALSDRLALVVVTEASLHELGSDAGDRRWGSPLLNMTAPHRVGLLTAADAYRLATEPAAEAGAPFSPAEADFLVATAGAHPYLLSVCASFVFDLRRDDPGVVAALATDPIVRRNVRQALLNQPAVAEVIVTEVDRRVDKASRQVLAQLVHGQPDPERYRAELNTLEGLGLVQRNLADGSYRLFAELLAEAMPANAGADSLAAYGPVLERLGPLDRRLLEHLLEHADETCSFDELFAAAWTEPGASRSALDAAIFRLRSRLREVQGPNGDTIESVRRHGYRFRPGPPAAPGD